MPTIVSSWAELVTALGNGTTDIKFSDSGDKVIPLVDINATISCSNSITIDFNGWTIEDMQIVTFIGSQHTLFNQNSTVCNLTINHLSIYKTAPIDVFLFTEVDSVYINDLYYEPHDSTYTEWYYKGNANIIYQIYNSTIKMRSRDYAPRVPWYFQGRCYNSEFEIDYKWTKTGAGNYHALFGCNSNATANVITAYMYSCYIHGKIDLSEGGGEWQFTTVKNGNSKIRLETCIVNIETITSENCTFDNFGISVPYPTSASTWADIPKKSLIVINNGNSSATYQSAIFQTGVYIGGVCANVVRTLKEDLKNKDWLDDIVFSYIEDDNYRYPQWGGICPKSDVTPLEMWQWRKSNVVNQAVPFLPFYKYPTYTPPPYYGDVPENEYICIYDLATPQNGFSGHGLAVLRPSSCRIVEELNGSYNLTLTHPRDSEGKWQYILEMNIIKALGQLFVIQRVDEVLSGNSYYVTAYAEHISYTLNDRWIFPPVTIAGYTGTSLMASILDQSTDMGGDWQTNYTFSVSSDIDAPSDFRDWYEMPDGVTPYEMLLGSQGYIAKLGGELYRDNFQMIINERMYGAQEDAFELSIGYNLTGIKRTVDLTTFVTYLRCYDVSNDDYGTWWAVSWDPSTLPRAYPRNVVRSKNFSYDHDEYKEGQLERDGFAFWNQNCAPLITYELNVKDLKNAPEYKDFANNYRFKVGDKGKVWDERLQAWSDVEITRTEKDGITGETVKVVIGSQRSFTRPNQYNPITPVRINADKVLEGLPPISFMSDGGNLHHITIYGASGGVGDLISYGGGGAVQSVHYSTQTGEPDTVTGYSSSTDTIPVQAGFTYTVSAYLQDSSAATGNYYVLYYDSNDNYLSYEYGNGESFTFIVDSGATKARVQVNTEVASFDVSGLAIPITLTQFDTRTIYIPLNAKIYEGQSWDLSSTSVQIPTWSGENILDVLTTVKPRVKITYKEPMNTSYERITQSTTPITIYADGTNLMNWVIYGAEGGVGGAANIFSGNISEIFYDYTTGRRIDPQYAQNFWSSDDVFPVIEGVEYEFIGVWSESVDTGYWVIFYDSNGNFVGNATGGGTSLTFTAPAGAATVRIEVGSTNKQPTTFILNAPALPVTVTQGTNSQTVVIPITAPLTENQSVSFEGTGINIPTYNGQTTISVASQVQPTMKIQYTERRG